jgi:hypothetical protein
VEDCPVSTRSWIVIVLAAFTLLAVLTAPALVFALGTFTIITAGAVAAYSISDDARADRARRLLDKIKETP